eukprot:2296729-Rhodomonas_salina.1
MDYLVISTQFPKMLRVPCHHCNEAKAKRQPYAYASTNELTNENDLMTWDLIDIGKNWTSIGGYHYISVFIIKRSRYAITILHKDRADFVSILRRAIAKAGFTPKRVRCNGAGEYVSAKLMDFFRENDILPEFSSPYEQSGNGISEKFVDTLGKGICTLLLQSNLPPEFWSAAAHYFTDVYKHVQHHSIGCQIPYAVHHCTRPDVSWFRGFGCSSTIFRGRDLVDHHKLAPQEESLSA